MSLRIAHFAPDPFEGMRAARRVVGGVRELSDVVPGMRRLLFFFRWDGRIPADFHFFKGRLTVPPRTVSPR
jgi:hypothetical protein